MRDFSRPHGSERAISPLTTWLSLTCIGMVTAAAAGVASTQVAGAGAPPAALLEAFALLVLAWPAASLAIDRLAQRQAVGWLAPGLYAGALIAFMAGSFHHGVPQAAGSAAGELLPAGLILVLMAWIALEALLPLRARSSRPEGSAQAA